MSGFKIGDRVLVRSPRYPEFNGPATVSYLPKNLLAPTNVHVRQEGREGPLSFPVNEVLLADPQFVNVQTQKTIWVTLPGDNAGHKLTNDDALTLLRQLEEALS